MQQEFQPTISKARPVSLRLQLVSFFLTVTVLITVAAGFIYNTREQMLLADNIAAQNDRIFRSLSSNTTQALREERPADLRAALARAGGSDDQLVRIAIENESAGISVDWRAPRNPISRAAVQHARDIMIGDERIGQITIVRDSSMAHARVDAMTETIYWIVGSALFVLSVVTLGCIEVMVIQPVGLVSGRLKCILDDPTIEPEWRTGVISSDIQRLEEAVGFLRKALLKGQQDEHRLRVATDEAVMASRAKSEFLANMSHELRTPLNSIIGFSEMIKLERLGELGNKKYVEYAQDIHGSGSHLLQIINDILDLSKVEAGKLELREEPVDIDHMTTACLSIVRERALEKNITVQTRIDPAFPPLSIDELRIRQALINLVGNAIKFTPDGGSVVVEAARSSNDLPYLRVIDNGIGIAPEDIEKAMEPFGQADGSLNRRYEGSGLGLPLTKALVELHDGRIEIDSAEGVGTTVTLVFPQERCQPISANPLLAAE